MTEKSSASLELLTADICVIGGGAAGLSVAAGAAAFGESVILIEAGRMGGECLNVGCVPSKSLLAAAKSNWHQLHPVIETGRDITGAPDFEKIKTHLRDVISAIEPHDSVERFEGLGVKVLKERAQFVSRDELQAGTYRIKARRYVIATGSSPRIPDIEGMDQVSCLTNETVFDLEALPRSLAVIGGGPMGVELAQAFLRLGVPVTLVETRKILPRDDQDCVAHVRQALLDEGLELLEDTSVNRVEKSGEDITLHLHQGEKDLSREVSHILLATGRQANTRNLGLEAAGVEYNASGIQTDKRMRTSNPAIYAAGDVTEGLRLTHAASAQASVVLKSILFRLPVSYAENTMPWVTYSSPEIGHAGLTLEEARRRYGGKVTTLQKGLGEVDRVRAEGGKGGLVKLYVGPGDRLLGADAVGENAGELIAFLSFACDRRMKMKDLASFTAPYPTVSEVVRQLALNYFSAFPQNRWVRRIISMLRCFG